MVPKENFNEIISSTLSNKDIKAAVTDMRHFARKIFLTSFIRKQNIGLIWQIVFKLEYLFYLKGRIPLLSLKQLVKSHESIIKFLVLKNVCNWSKFNACIVFSWNFGLCLMNSGSYFLNLIFHYITEMLYLNTY